MTPLRKQVLDTLAAKVLSAIEDQLEAEFSDAIATLHGELDDVDGRVNVYAVYYDALIAETLAHILLERSGYEGDDSLATIRGDNDQCPTCDGPTDSAEMQCTYCRLG